jgi:hypothetical protein
MSRNVTLLRRLEAARRRVRDASAAALQAAEAAHNDAKQRVVEAEALVEHLIDARVERLTQETSPTALLRLADEVGQARAVSVVARAHADAAAGGVATAVSLLRARAVELGASERVLERALGERRLRVERYEQRVSDDLSAARRSGREGR